MNQKHKHLITISYEKNLEFPFNPNIPLIKRHISFLLDLICNDATEVSIRFCGTEEMLQMNTQFRGKQKPTDVLSFIPNHSIDQNPNYLGDVLVCVPVCLKQAKQAKHSLSEELIKMLTHSLVHLKGFDHDRSDSAERVMSKLERALRTELTLVFGQKTLTKES